MCDYYNLDEQSVDSGTRFIPDKLKNHTDIDPYVSYSTPRSFLQKYALGSPIDV